MKKVLINILIVVIFLYFLLFINTNSIVKYAEDVMTGKYLRSETSKTALGKYNYSDVLINAKVKANVTRLFVAHNFFDGYMWVMYSYRTIENDGSINPAASNVISRWKIHREDGKWQVVEIQEKP